MENFHTEMFPDPLPITGEEGSARRMLIDMIETLVISLVLFVVINQVSARIKVESVSMKETLYPGNFVLVNKLAYRFGELGRGDIIVFDPPFDAPEPYVKRIIGLPGEIVNIQDGNVYIDDVLVPEPYVRANSRTNGTWEVPEGSIFVMGDNRNNSSDSRSWGMVPVENIIGKALFVYWPIDQWGALALSAAAAESP